ncbi:cytochrome P450 [Fomitopsis betulina]|nr:cytochrome P450 [Fomitopsis betulina]
MLVATWSSGVNIRNRQRIDIISPRTPVFPRGVVTTITMLTILSLCLVVFLLVQKLIHARHALGSLPPGPRGLPLLGNALQISLTYSWLAFTGWAERYGDVMHLSVLGKSLVILSSREAVTELLEKRGAIYSDRPIIPMAGVLAGYGKYTGMLPYGPSHREGRKLILGTLSLRNAQHLQAIQEEKVTLFVSKLAADPSKFLLHIQWLVASVVLQITHGSSIEDTSDPIVQRVHEVMSNFSKLSAQGAWLVDSFPILMYVPDWFPGAAFKRVARDARQQIATIEEMLYDIVQQQQACGQATQSFTADLLHNNPSPSPEQLVLWKEMGLHFYTAGADTTVSAIETFVILMSQNLAIQRKAQVEVDTHTQRTRPPRSSDRDALPYLNAVLKEVLRIHPVGPLALPHTLRQDDFYKGYWIPAGATVLANSWAILHDPSLYPNPETVDPGRYLQRGKSNTINPDPRAFAFGYGRRVCPGQMLAEDMLFLAAANILAHFDVSNARSFDGSEPRWEGSIICHPLPFKCTFEPRVKVPV